MRFVSLLALLVFLAAPAAAESPEDDVYRLMAERLALMPGIAAFKQARGLAVEDLAREQVVLDKAAAAAVDAGLDPKTIRPFFQAQMDAAKAVQFCWIARWDDGSATPPTNPPDLKTEVRPQQIEIGKRLNAAIADALADGTNFEAGNAEGLAIDCLPADHVDALSAALQDVQPAD